MPAKRRTSLSSFNPSRKYKPKTLGQLTRTERERPRCARQPFNPEIACRIWSAISACHCLTIQYPDDHGEPQQRLFCPAAMGLKDGLLKAAGMQRKASEEPPGHMALFVSCISSAESAVEEWIPTPGDLADSTQFAPGRILRVSACHGDPTRDDIRLFPYYRELDDVRCRTLEVGGEFEPEP